jgi:hypothetical protein
MERARKIKKGDPTFCVSPLLLTSLSAVFIFFLRFSLALFLKGSYVERLAKKQKHTHHFPGDPVFFFKR